MCVCMVHVCCHGIHVEVRGQLSGVSYTLLSPRVLRIELRLSCGFMGTEPGSAILNLSLLWSVRVILCC